jgi:hypothetical protein
MIHDHQTIQTTNPPRVFDAQKSAAAEKMLRRGRIVAFLSTRILQYRCSAETREKGSADVALSSGVD